MASKGMFQPPILKSEQDFENWEHEIKIWQCVMDLENKKQAPEIYLSFEGQARQCCDDIKAETLRSYSGVDELIKKLKTLYDAFLLFFYDTLPMKNLKLFKDHQV